MSYLYEFPTVIINQRLFDLGLADCYSPGLHAVTLSDVRDFKTAALHLPGEDVLEGTTLIYRNGDRFFITVPYNDVRAVFMHAFSDVRIYSYTEYLKPVISVTDPNYNINYDQTNAL